MARKSTPGIDIGYGWNPGESGIAAELDDNWLKLGVLINLSVKSRTTALPGSPADGDLYIVPSGAAEHANEVAARVEGTWRYLVPKRNWLARIEDEGDAPYRHTGTAWSKATAANLEALAGLSGAANKLAYFTDAGAMALADLTAKGRSLIGADDVEPLTDAEKTKLAGIEDGATANSTDAELRDRATHTGAQAISTVTGLQAALLDPYRAIPTLDLDFTSGSMLSGVTRERYTRAPDKAGIGNIVTFIRASTGTYFDANGVLQTAAADTMRIDYDPVTLACRGLLVEEQRTNLLRRSSELDSATWAKSNGSISANVATFIDGQQSFDRFVPDTTYTVHQLSQGGISVTAGTTYTISLIVKADGYRYVAWNFNGSLFGNDDYATFDLQAGTVSAAGTSGTAAITALGNGVYRCSRTLPAIATGTASIFIQVGESSNMGRGLTFAGDGVSGVLIGGAQWEAGTLTSYIPTTTAQVTRAADAVTISTLSPWFNATEGTLFSEATRFGTSGTSTTFNIGPGDADRIFTATQVPGTSGSGGSVNVGGAPVATMQSAIGAANQKVALAYKANDFAAAGNGLLAGTDTSGALPTVSSAKIGANQSSYFNGHIRRVRYYPTRFSNSNAELEELTAA